MKPLQEFPDEIDGEGSFINGDIIRLRLFHREGENVAGQRTQVEEDAAGDGHPDGLVGQLFTRLLFVY